VTNSESGVGTRPRSSSPAQADRALASLSYPSSRRGDDNDDYHGEVVADPFRWLEDTNAEETRLWAEAQNELTQSYLAAVPSREQIRTQLRQRWDYARFGVPFERGGRWFQSRNSGLLNQPVFYSMSRPDDEGAVVLDPNTLSDNGTVAVVAVSVSPDGSKMAYATSESGSDWLSWHIRDVSTGTDLSDRLVWCRSPDATWAKDGAGFYYSAMTPPTAGREYLDQSHEKRIFFHLVGRPQLEDELVFAPEDFALWPELELSADGRYLIVSLSRGIGPGVEVRVLDLERFEDGFRVLLPESDAKAVVVANSGKKFFVLTDAGAPTGRIVARDLARQGETGSEECEEVVPPCEDTLLEAHFFGGRLVCHYLEEACSALRVFELNGSRRGDIALPAMATLAGSQVGHELIEGAVESDLVHFEVVSFRESASLWSHDLATGKTSLVRPADCSLSEEGFITEQVQVTSSDGTRVPLFLTRRRGLVPDGDVPVLLYGYGGVGVPITPSFSVPWAVFIERGGMLAVASLRGGGEFGRSWHEAGKGANKQNVFDDFCACARWLVRSGWSKAARIAINGGSNGGLLVGACLAQHPELFGAAVAEVGVHDMLRFCRFTIGWAWKTEYGDPEDPEQYRWLRAYSPLHNLRPARYPATLITTADHDDRVVPGHSFKFAATLQHAQLGDAPVLLRMESAAGHGGGKPTAKEIDAATDKLAFIEMALAVSNEKAS
jgi:prolyl oligopeptidase